MRTHRRREEEGNEYRDRRTRGIRAQAHLGEGLRDRGKEELMGKRRVAEGRSRRDSGAWVFEINPTSYSPIRSLLESRRIPNGAVAIKKILQ